MSVTRPFFEDVNLDYPVQKTLPTMYDLPSEVVGEPGLPDLFHIWQAQLCSETFCPPDYEGNEVLVASDLNLYYDPSHTGWYKRPDWYAVVGVSRLYEGRDLRMSYVMWQEGVIPAIIIEFLSASTRSEDLGYTTRSEAPPTKWQVYEQILAIPYYVTFDRVTNDLQIFQLDKGRYQRQTLEDSKFWIPHLQLGLGLWSGSYQGVDRLWLRWYDQTGNWISTSIEREQQERVRAEQERVRAEQERFRAEQERVRAEQERQEKELAQQRAEKLAEQLRQMGINPDEL